ncbi:lipase 1-like [Leguminivora glycinivorella]|uniref:lipase 1-like n=1 Tax=Leguminivora glycinivorella TaxID=1035111 RepID=UPI00200DCFD7|nr:lipase 1-like [Leguminivora glycinivorella]
MTESSLSILFCVIFSILHISKAENSTDSFFTQLSEATLSEDGKLDFPELATKYGLSVEQYDVTTEDGYILTVFHVAKDLNASNTPILLFHGIIDSCYTFMLRGETSWVYTLAQAGYGVWVGNNRGNLYGRRHVSLNPDKDEKFWDYSLHEIGFYDLAATIDFIRKTTYSDSILTIGHSQGTSAHFVLTSTRPEYNDRIKLFVALAPIAYLINLKPPISIAAAAGPTATALLTTLNINELLENHSAASDLVTLLCSKGVVSYLACGFGTLFPLAGFDPAGLEEDFLTGVVFGHYPSATSRKSLVHYDQIFLRRDFAQYDYGSVRNLAKYKGILPPSYNLTAVTTNVALFVGGNDKVSTLKDVKRLGNVLSNVVHYEVMELKRWNHLDFVWGKDIMTEYLYPPVLDLLEQYRN